MCGRWVRLLRVSPIGSTRRLMSRWLLLHGIRATAARNSFAVPLRCSLQTEFAPWYSGIPLPRQFCRSLSETSAARRALSLPPRIIRLSTTDTRSTDPMAVRRQQRCAGKFRLPSIRLIFLTMFARSLSMRQLNLV